MNVKYFIIIITSYLAMIAIHGFIFHHEGQNFLNSIMTSQWLWIVYFFISYLIAEHLSKKQK